MIKNILIFILIVIAAFLFVLNKNTQQMDLDKKIDDGGLMYKKTDEANDSEENKTVPSGNSLDLSGQGLDKLPSYVLDRTSLEVLDISDNDLTGALPAEIRHLKKLKVLNASNNDMTGVPAEVGQLENLEVLDLSNNQLTGLPYELGNLKKLKTLDLSGNDYAKQDLEIIKKGLPSDVDIIL